MGKLHEFRIKHNNFVKGLDSTIEKIVNFNEDLEAINKEQLRSSKLANDRPIVNRFTNRPNYSPSYAFWKRKFFSSSFGDGKINLLLTGTLYDNLEIKVKGRKYQLLSLVSHAASLIRKYSNLIFGIAPSNRQKAQAITTKLLAKEYRRRVFS